MSSTDTNLRVYVVTQYPSQANRRVVKVLELHDAFERMTLVCEPGEKLHSHTLAIKKPRNPTAILSRLGLRQLRRAIDQRIFFPSPAVLYVKAAIKELIEHIQRDLREQRPVCLITMTPPHDVAVIGLELKRKFSELSWIIDWQDLWSYDEYYFGHVPIRNQQRVKDLELELLNECDLNIVTNPAAKAVLEDSYNVPEDRVISISHPFDHEELGDSIGLHRDNGSRALRVGFLGHLFKLPKVPGDRVIEAFDHVRQEGLDVELHVFGDLQTITKNAASNRDWMHLHPRLPHNKSLQEVRNCDFLLLTLADLPNTKIIMHAKLSHYLILDRPIIAMVPNQSFVADLIRETGVGYVVSTEENWGARLAEILRDHSSQSLQSNRNLQEIDKYSWNRISKLWIDSLLQVSSVSR